MNNEQIITDVILAILTLVAGYVARAANAWFLAHVSVANQTLVEQVAVVAIHASQQLFDIGAIKDRKAHATDVINAAIAKAGITLTAQQISDAIEAAVHAELKSPPAVVVADPLPQLTPAGTTTATVNT